MNRRYFLKVLGSLALAVPFAGLLPTIKEPNELDIAVAELNKQFDGYIDELKRLTIVGTTSLDGEYIVLANDNGNILLAPL